MRVITAYLDYLSFYGEDSKAQEEKRVAKRRYNLDKVGVVLGENEDIKHPTVTLTENQAIDLMLLGELLTVKSSVMVADDRVLRAAEAIEKVAAKLERFADGIGPDRPDSNAFNEKVEVYTPGAGLMLFNRVLLLQDSCSDELQRSLDEGWRIIAACPQPDQRRPDYILGRYDPKDAAEAYDRNAKRTIDV